MASNTCPNGWQRHGWKRSHGGWLSFSKASYLPVSYIPIIPARSSCWQDGHSDVFFQLCHKQHDLSSWVELRFKIIIHVIICIHRLYALPAAFRNDPFLDSTKGRIFLFPQKRYKWIKKMNHREHIFNRVHWMWQCAGNEWVSARIKCLFSVGDGPR